MRNISLRTRTAVAALATSLALYSGTTARAGDLIPGGAVPAPDASFGGIPLPDGVRITVGASLLYLPKYDGAASYTVTALPIFKLAPLVAASGAGGGGILGALGRFDAKNLDDISFALVKHDGFEFGPLAGVRLGRAEKDSPRLAGLGDIDGGIVAGAFVKYGSGPMYMRGSVHQRITGDDTGLIGRFALGAKFHAMPRVLVKAEASLDFADSAYMQAYFGVTAAQSVRSGLNRFEPGVGAKSASLTLAADYALTPDWTLLTSAGYTRLLGDAADSPIVERPDRIDLKLGVSRAFDWKFR